MIEFKVYIHVNGCETEEERIREATRYLYEQLLGPEDHPSIAIETIGEEHNDS